MIITRITLLTSLAYVDRSCFSLVLRILPSDLISCYAFFIPDRHNLSQCIILSWFFIDDLIYYVISFYMQSSSSCFMWFCSKFCDVYCLNSRTKMNFSPFYILIAKLQKLYTKLLTPKQVFIYLFDRHTFHIQWSRTNFDVNPLLITVYKFADFNSLFPNEMTNKNKNEEATVDRFHIIFFYIIDDVPPKSTDLVGERE